MDIELQVSTEKLAAVLEDIFRARRPCAGFELAFNEMRWYLDRMETSVGSFAVSEEIESIALNRLVTPEDGSPFFVPTTHLISLQRPTYIQPVSLFLVKYDELIAANLSPVDGPFELKLNFVVSLEVLSSPIDGVSICLRFVDVKSSPETDGDQITSDDRQRLLIALQSGGPICGGFSLGQIGGVIDLNLPVVVNGGISLSADKEFAAVRLDANPDPSETATEWQQFYSGRYQNLVPPENDWAVFIGKQLVFDGVRNLYDSEIAYIEATTDFDVQSQPNLDWRGGSPPQIDVSFSGEIIDGCLGIDVDVDIDVAVKIRVPDPGNLALDASVDFDVNDGEAFLCNLGRAFLPIFVQPFVAPSLPEKLKWEFGFSDNLGPFLRGLILSKATGNADGLILAGSIAFEPLTFGLLDIKRVSSFGFELARPCHSLSDGDYIALVDWALEPIAEQNNAPLFVCRTAILEDPDNLFRVIPDPSGKHSDAKVAVGVTEGRGYKGSSYPCRLLIASNAGVRILTIPASEPVDQTHDFNDIATWIGWKSRNCWKYASIWDHIHAFNPEWVINPVLDVISKRRWTMTIAGLEPNQIIEVLAKNDEPVSRYFANVDGAVFIDELLEGDQNITIRDGTRFLNTNQIEAFSKDHVSSTSEPETRIAQLQRLMIERDRISVSGEPQYIRLLHDSKAHFLEIGSYKGSRFYAIAGNCKLRSLSNEREKSFFGPFQRVCTSSNHDGKEFARVSAQEVNDPESNYLSAEDKEFLSNIDGLDNYSATKISRNKIEVSASCVTGEQRVFNCSKGLEPREVSKHLNGYWKRKYAQRGKWLALWREAEQSVVLYETLKRSADIDQSGLLESLRCSSRSS